MSVIGVSLSKPNTSVTVFAEVVCMSVCLWPYTVNFSLDQFSRSLEVRGGALGKAREGLADVISIHELLTNQILLPSFEAVVTRGDYAFAK